MIRDGEIFDMSGHLALLSLISVGGGLVMIAPDVHAYVVEGRHWLASAQFAAAYAIAQAAPGPNLLFISLVGWLVAGWFGAIAATVAVILPSTVLTLALIRLRARRRGNTDSRDSWQDALRHSFSPVSIGLLAATAWMFARASNADWRADLLTLVAALVVSGTKLNPVLMIAAGAVAGVAHWI